MTTARHKRTNQAPGRPSLLLGEIPEQRRAGHPSPTRRAHADARTAGRAPPPGGAPRRTSIRAEVGRWRGETGATAEGSGRVGGPHTSVDVGERIGTL
jgi:hypothetical protein